MKTKRIARLGIFMAALMTAMLVEGLFPPPPLPIPVKWGLSNVVIMQSLLFFGPVDAAVLVAVRSLYGLAVRGPLAALLSFGGGIVSLLVMALGDRLSEHRISLVAVSSLGGICHNLTQWLIYVFVFSLLPARSFLYLGPPLMLLGLIAGIVTGIIAKYVRIPLWSSYKQKSATGDK